MSDYISRQAVKKQIVNSFVTDEFCSTEADTFIADNLILKEIDKVPNADVVEVKRGEWIELPSSGIGNTAECSVCHDKVYGYVTCNYCPNCGADMRG